MNEAENSNSPDWLEYSDSQDDSAQAVEGAIESAIVVHSAENGVQEPAEDGWQTVNFPNALSVDQIPHAEEVEQANARISQLEQQYKAAIDHIQMIEQQQTMVVECIRDLEQRNSGLTTQTSRLEEALEQSRKAVRLERRRWKTQMLAQIAQTEEKLQAQAAIVSQKDQALMDAQHSIAKLFHELEQSHQTAQKQQILIETLTGQLESSQEQVAQLERECALTQQRYDDQIQTVRQAENSCRDLRSRLHRQQRYTLQFKAALEKCLEVPAPQFQAEVSEMIGEKSDAPIQLFAPKAQPVQPWSAQPEYLAIDSSTQFTEGAIEPDFYSTPTTPTVWDVEPEPPILDSISELNLEASTSEEASPLMPDVWASDSVELSVELSEITLPQPPTQPTPVSYTIKPVEAPDTPEETVHHWNVQLFNPQFDTPADHPVSEPTHSETDLEQKLSAALETFETFESQTDELQADRSQPAPEPVSLEKSLLEEPTAASTDETSDSTPPEAELAILESKVDGESVDETLITPFEQVILDHFSSTPLVTLPSATQSPEPALDSSPFITLQPTAQFSEPVEQAEEVATVPFRSGPSPVVYPLRSTKKRQSLAAVELPSFPRRGK
ncbi:hypothetical protein ACKFKG_14155 [Phormidesmis sp. 146-35]